MNINPLWHIGDAVIALVLMIIALVDVKWAVVAYFAVQVVGELIKAFVAFLRPVVDAAKRAQQ